ncbi:MAG: hypothetical protein NW237_01010 [Cyanobacteriota bacterium]|nr:hypothetical protein [Cyanobacteriota bacterium]
MSANPIRTSSIGANEVQGLEYVVLGVATCFQRDEEGRLNPVLIAEPVPAAELDCLAQGIRSTSYQLLYATTYAEIVQDNQPILPQDVIPAEALPGENFVQRVQAATRTYRAKPQFRHIPLHESCTTETGIFRLKHQAEPRRVINAVYEVSDGDNVKQHPHTHQQL